MPRATMLLIHNLKNHLRLAPSIWDGELSDSRAAVGRSLYGARDDGESVHPWRLLDDIYNS